MMLIIPTIYYSNFNDLMMTMMMVIMIKIMVELV
jgi:hypothetical protein